MVNGDAILESLQAQMQESNKEFDAINAEIEKTAEEYNEKILTLQKEGNAKLEELSKRREQIRGEYTGLYNMYMKFKAPKEDNKKEEVKPEAKVVEMKPKATKAKSTKKEDNALTAEEVAKLQQAMNKNNQPKEEDIPDYLKPEYNK